MERKLLCSICEGDKETPKACAKYYKGCCIAYGARKSKVCDTFQGKEYTPCPFHPCALITED